MYRCKFRRLDCWLCFSRLAVALLRQLTSTRPPTACTPRFCCIVPVDDWAYVRLRKPVSCRTGVSNPSMKNALVTSTWGRKLLKPFSTLLAAIISNQNCVAKMSKLHLHLPSSPTMSLRSDDAESTRYCQVSFILRKRQTECERCADRRPPGSPLVPGYPNAACSQSRGSQA
jgi:hypothetical protein